MENEKVISVAEMRAADAYTIENFVPGRELMYRAAHGVFESYDWEDKRALIFCGGGNNGGDGYALAMILAEQKHEVKIVRVSEKLSEDGGYYYEKCIDAGVPMIGMDTALNSLDEKYDVVVDCILGTGFSGSVRGNAKNAIEIINSMRSAAYIISVDINSGMNGDTGEAELAVTSDLTVSIGFLKTGFFRGRAKELIGRLVNVDIGIKLP
jgi:NAD(P)H-hydrate epimerase